MNINTVIKSPATLVLSMATVPNVSDSRVFLTELERDAGQISPELLILKNQWLSVSITDLEFHIDVQGSSF